MKAKWCSYRYKGTGTKWRFTKWQEHKTLDAMMAELKANKFGMSLVQVVINPENTGSVEGNELWEWRPGRGWHKCPASRRNWYRDSCDPNCPPSTVTDEDIFNGTWEAKAAEDDKAYDEYIHGTVTRSIQPALALQHIFQGDEIPTDEQLAQDPETQF